MAALRALENEATCALFVVLQYENCEEMILRLYGTLYRYHQCFCKNKEYTFRILMLIILANLTITLEVHSLNSRMFLTNHFFALTDRATTETLISDTTRRKMSCLKTVVIVAFNCPASVVTVEFFTVEICTELCCDTLLRRPTFYFSCNSAGKMAQILLRNIF